MNSRARNLVFGLVLIGLAFWAIGIREQAQRPRPQPTPPSTIEPPPTKRSVPKANSSATPPYDFSPIQSKLNSHRLQLAACLLRNPNTHARQYRLTLSWEPQGRIRQARLDPEAGDAVTSCIRDLAETWEIQPHPALQPFSYSAFLIPDGV